MKNRFKTLTVFAMMVSVLFVALPVMANITVTGEVGSANEIMSDDGAVYIIDETEKGDELASMVGETVEVTGTVEESDGVKIITVDSFIVINK
jgi:hypothetical protein